MQEMQERWVQSLDWEDSLEKAMAIHSSILAWRIPWMEEPGRLQSMGSQRVRQKKINEIWRKKLAPEKSIFLMVKCPPIPRMREDYKLISNDSSTESLMNVIIQHVYHKGKK